MSARGLHIIAGAKFHHAHVQCDACACRVRNPNASDTGFEWLCTAKARVLCCLKPRACRDFKPYAKDTGRKP